MAIPPELRRRIVRIRDDRVHGASELAQQALAVLKTAVEISRAETVPNLLRELEDTAQMLRSVRPAMAPIRNIVDRYLDTLPADSEWHVLEPVIRLALASADQITGESLEAVRRIARSTCDLIADGDRIMTHSYSSTVAATLKEAFSRHRDISVIVTRSGPGRTGERILRELAGGAASIALIDDTAAGVYMPTISRVLVGADRISADGKLINGVGTYPLSLSARQARVPLYVLCDTLKFDPAMTAAEVDLEDRDPQEVVAPGTLPPHVSVKNPHFDITPLELVTAVVTEDGVLKPEEVTRYLRRRPEPGA